MNKPLIKQPFAVSAVVKDFPILARLQDGKPLNDADDKRLDKALEQITIQGRKLNAR